MNRQRNRNPPRRQRGAIAIIVGLTMVVIIGFAGLALDGGRLYVNKTETQNAADACALAAAQELTGAPNIPVANFGIAENAGRLVATRNRTDFQQAFVANANVTVQFSTALSGASWVAAAAAGPSAQFVRCTIAQPNIAPWFMQVLGFGNQTVSSFATATLAPSANVCTAIPVGLCGTGTTPPYGLATGQWFCTILGGGACPGSITGNFGWIDFSPPAGGASELAPLLSGSGACTVTPGTSVGVEVGEPGAMASLIPHWNTRFGIYAPGGPGIAGAVPDYTGYAYTPVNWTSGAGAFGDFLTKRTTNAPYGVSAAAGNAVTGLSVQNSDTVRQAAQLATSGSQRRVVPVPIVNCAGYESGSTTTLIDWACVLMLHPISGTGPPSSKEVRLEYIGLASDPGSPCASVGGVGGPGATGPLVPALVQ